MRTENQGSKMHAELVWLYKQSALFATVNHTGLDHQHETAI